MRDAKVYKFIQGHSDELSLSHNSRLLASVLQFLQYVTGLCVSCCSQPRVCRDVCGWQSCCQCHLALCVYRHLTTLCSTCLHTPNFSGFYIWKKASVFACLCVCTCKKEVDFLATEWQAEMFLCWHALRRTSLPQCYKVQSMMVKFFKKS